MSYAQQAKASSFAGQQPSRSKKGKMLHFLTHCVLHSCFQRTTEYFVLLISLTVLNQQRKGSRFLSILPPSCCADSRKQSNRMFYRLVILFYDLLSIFESCWYDFSRILSTLQSMCKQNIPLVSKYISILNKMTYLADS